MTNLGWTPLHWVLLAVGGTLGTWARFALGGIIASRWVHLGLPAPLGLPAGTWSINVLGGLLIGVIAALATGKTPIVTAEVRLLLAVGFCGAFTTFSTFGLETLTLVQAGKWGQAAGYVLATNLFVLLAAGGGLWLGRWLHHSP